MPTTQEPFVESDEVETFLFDESEASAEASDASAKTRRRSSFKDIAIEKDVPIPALKRGARSLYPWDKMEVGDSIFVAGRNTKSMSTTASVASRRHGIKLRVRAVDGGVRVWRIA